MKIVDAVGRVLQDSTVFRGLAPHHEELIAGCASLETFAVGDYIYREEQAADQFYLIRHGRVALEVHVPGRAPIIVDTIGEGEPLGWSWLIPPYRTNFDARAMQLARMIRFDTACLRAKMEADKEFGYELFKRMMPVVAARLAAARRQLIDVYGTPDVRGAQWR